MDRPFLLFCLPAAGEGSPLPCGCAAARVPGGWTVIPCGNHGLPAEPSTTREDVIAWATANQGEALDLLGSLPGWLSVKATNEGAIIAWIAQDTDRAVKLLHRLPSDLLVDALRTSSSAGRDNWTIYGDSATRRDGLRVQTNWGKGPDDPAVHVVTFPGMPGAAHRSVMLRAMTTNEAVDAVDRRWPIPRWWTSVDTLPAVGPAAYVIGAEGQGIAR